MRFRNSFPVSCLFLCLTGLLGAEEKEETLAPGHSHLGEAFNEGPRQQAYLMEGTGTIDFPVSTKSEEAQKFFNQGVGQLHGFWDFEAERSFRQVLFLDPDCAMAYWGIAMANNRNEKRAAEIIEEAKPAIETGQLSKREEMYLQSLVDYYSDLKKDKKDRKREWVRDLEAIVQEYPEDLEAVAFLVLEIWRNSRAGLKINSHLAVDSLIERVLAKNPMHSVHHYRIHLWDYENPKVAIPAAARCGQSAPGIAHMWHMPGHTFSKRSRYADAAWQQEASARVDHAHMMRDRLMPDQISNYAHNNGWLVENLGFLGRADDGISLAKNLIELPRLEKLTSVEKDGPKYYNPGQGSYGEGRKRLFTLLVDYERWEDLLDLTEGPYLTTTGDPGEDAKRLCHQGIAHFALGRNEDASRQFEAIDSIIEPLQERKDEASAKAKKKAEDEDKNEKEIKKAEKDGGKRWERHINTATTWRKRLAVYEAVYTKPPVEAREKLDKVKGLSALERARLYKHMANWEKAESLLKSEEDKKKNPLLVRANRIEVLNLLNRKDDVKKSMEALRPLAVAGNLETPALKRVKPIAKKLKLPEDWRGEAKTPDDLIERPELADLGPFRWSPVKARPWTLTDAEGQEKSLTDFEGNPVVVIFYLGKGCKHCLEQLTAFEPLHDAYAEAGIELVAISMDQAEGLKQTFALSSEGEDAENPFSFPLLSDASLEAFKAYRAYDEFENQPLHGTFLVDERGYVRWQDISFEPMMEPAWLLEESKRLLKLPGGEGVIAATGEDDSQS